MRSRAASIFLIVAFALVGAGVLRFVHDLGHLAEDAAAQAHHHDGDPHGLPPVHTEWNCELHGLLAGPLVAGSVLPALIVLGLFVAFLTQLRPAVVSRRPTFRLTCRGPPVC